MEGAAETLAGSLNKLDVDEPTPIDVLAATG